jgi:hypothetical protein
MLNALTPPPPPQQPSLRGEIRRRSKGREVVITNLNGKID